MGFLSLFFLIQFRQISTVVLTFKLLLNLRKAIIFNNNKTSGHSSVVERLVANEKVEGSSPLPAPN